MATSTTKTPSTRRATPPRTTTSGTATSSTATSSTATRTTKAEAPVQPEPRIVAIAPTVTLPELKKKDLLEQVVTRSGIKKKDAKPVVEAMLAILGETLSEGRDLNLTPFGKLRINRAEEKANGEVIVCKLRRPKPTTGTDASSPTSPLAEDADAE